MAKAIAASFLVLMLGFPTVFGVDYDVGDSNGWTSGVDYTTWVSGKTFNVGDNLVFKYDSSHEVDEVNESGYSSCSSSNLIKNHNDGNSKIALSATGNRYFICPRAGHCAGGMKLQINVVAANSTTPPTTPSTPSSPPSESGTPSTTNSTSPPSKPNGAVGVSGSIGLLAAASAVVLGFMG
ncbi:uclacyanin-3 [Vigna radiata var. radiata]|uniref:Uclacyanin-3 n=1 Tax=Vigna radiata var. radiata TaxID=3916 RepID=A0A1S3VCQ4_VIGRR|nr:uclacyanin-3 [Vigna radiata var. radiata]